MKPSNYTTVMYFIIKGISDAPELQAPIFLLVLLIYLITLGGNMTVLLLVCVDPHLHTPMYFFLVNLSVMDMSSTTVTLHKILFSFVSGNNTISFIGCMTQFYFFLSLTAGALLILTAMSYDRYVAICNPLHYHVVMKPRVCTLLAIVCWVWGFTETMPYVVIISSFTCYLTIEINHFLCDILPLRKLTCSDTSLLDLSLSITSAFHSTIPLLLTFIPYIFIIITIFRIKSSTGRRKAFYTCSSHLTVIIVLYGTLLTQYLIPSSMDSLESSKLFSLFNTAAVPVLNPLIYSLKNEAVKSALRRTLRSCKVKNVLFKGTL
ncbi:olfactory receptor 8B8-like [Discoglossus pictus]